MLCRIKGGKSTLLFILVFNNENPSVFICFIYRLLVLALCGIGFRTFLVRAKENVKLFNADDNFL